jgi:hypothetical protein
MQNPQNNLQNMQNDYISMQSNMQSNDQPLGLVGKAKAGSSRLTWTAWVQFPAFPRLLS